MDISEKKQNQLIRQALGTVPADQILALAHEYVDIDGLKEAEKLTSVELASTYAVAGFCAGIKFTLENLDVTDDEKE